MMWPFKKRKPDFHTFQAGFQAGWDAGCAVGQAAVKAAVEKWFADQGHPGVTWMNGNPYPPVQPRKLDKSLN